MRSRLFVLCLVLVFLVGASLVWRELSSSRHAQPSVPIVTKQPVAFASHTFDPASSPPDMPVLSPGEAAVCDSNFISNATVRGDTRQTDSTHATVIITAVTLTLRLDINIWVPIGASQHLLDHEQGHRQISEFYYQTADKLAGRIATAYIGRHIEITGTDLNGKSTKALQQTAAEINEAYKQQLNPEPTQLLYDDITDHGRNDTFAHDAVVHALKNAGIESTGAAP